MKPHRVAAVLAAVALGLLVVPASASHDGDVDCPNFDSPAEAQVHLLAHPGDPDDLDADSDGIPCEEFFTPAQAQGTTTSEPEAGGTTTTTTGGRQASTTTTTKASESTTTTTRTSGTTTTTTEDDDDDGAEPAEAMQGSPTFTG
jgi:hypothetical protein